MNRSAFVLAMTISLAVSALGCGATTSNVRAAKPQTNTGTSMSNSSRDTVQKFFTAFGKGDVEGVVDSFDPAATIVAVRAGKREGQELYGSYRGTTGAREFVANLGRTFDTQAFTVDALVGEGELAFARGSFTHKVKATGKLYSSDWALTCVVRAQKIIEYRFFEDSASFVSANAAPGVASAP